MDVCEFQGRIFGKLKGHIFVLDYSWDTVRPIQYVGWDGTKFEIVDKLFKQNLFDPYYGFGSKDMKELCDKLFNSTNFEHPVVFTNPSDFWRWCGHKTQWWRDRDCLFASSCVSPSVESWKQLIQITHSKVKTLKQKIRIRATKRLLPK
jgi:hypothetical protein